MKSLFLTVVIFCFGILFLMRCAGTEGENLPPATGLSGDIYLIMDSAQYRSPLGRTLDSIFTVEMQGLPREEPIFNLLWIDPRKMNMVLKQRRNLIYAVTLDRKGAGARQIKKMFTPESIEKIQQDPDFFVRTVSDVYGKGQEVMYLFGETQEELLANIRQNAQSLVSYFNRTERERLTRQLFKAGQVKGITEALQKELDCSMRIPFGYKLVQYNDEFLWARQINPTDDRDLFVARKPYTSADAFTKENLIAFRNEICKKYLFEDPEQPDSYVTTETNVPFIPVTVDTINFRGHFATEMRGLWRTNTATMGGPFVSYATVDNNNGQFYYIEGFVYGPSRDLRELIREMETILHTFRLREDSTTAKK